MASYIQTCLADAPALLLDTGAASGTFTDRSTNGATGTPHGTITYRDATSHPGLPYGVTFGGTIADYITVPYSAAVDQTGDVTYECWFKYTDSTRHNWLMGKGDDATAGTHGFVLYVNSGTATIRFEKSGVTLLIGSAAALATGASYRYIAVTRSGNNFVLYVDGVQTDTATTAATIDSVNTTPFWIGAGQYSTNNVQLPTNGGIAFPAIYPTPLSAARIAAHYAARDTAASSGGSGGSVGGIVSGLAAQGVFVQASVIAQQIHGGGGKGPPGSQGPPGRKPPPQPAPRRLPGTIYPPEN